MVLELLLSRIRGPKKPLAVSNVALLTPAEMLEAMTPASELKLHSPSEALRRHSPAESLKRRGR